MKFKLRFVNLVIPRNEFDKYLAPLSPILFWHKFNYKFDSEINFSMHYAISYVPYAPNLLNSRLSYKLVS